jgi:spermidine/putrescine transport system substrate-binding protein
LIFDPDLQPEKFVLIDSVRDSIGAALQYLGHSLNSTNPQELKAARDLILEAKPRAVGFAGSVEGKNKVLSKVAQAAVVYNGEAVRGMEDDPDTRYLIPKEGSQIWVDNLAVPARAPHRELAETFINFLLEPKIGAQISNYTRFATPNNKARSHIDPEDLQNPAIYPPAEVREKLQFLKDLGQATQLYDEIWTQIKAR